MHVKWSHEAGSYVWSCIYGCAGTDCESQWEAEQAFLGHACPRSA